ncbi:hypothetical protein [Bacillus subtilis]|uniref:hypothetical protein n=1 Tax=Bacillus subtilis TaxID=1423 RepID=UPI0040451F67
MSWVRGEAGAYSAAKCAEWGLINVLRLNSVPKNVIVAGLHLSFMDTNMTASMNTSKGNFKGYCKNCNRWDRS